MPEQRPQPPGKLGRRWKRTAAAALLLLAGGAVVNVAVAWGCVLVDVSRGSFMSLDLRDDDQTINIHRMARFGALRIWSAPDWGFGSSESPSGRVELAVIPGWSRVHELDVEIEYAQPYVQFEYEDARGWPCLALRSGFDSASYSLKHKVVSGAIPGATLYGDSVSFEMEDGAVRTVPVPAGNCVQHGMLVSSPRATVNGDFRIIPLRPIWPGFIINTLFYALLLWLLFFAPFAARRMIRPRRGLCAKCAYPVGSSPVCTECGAAVTSHGRTPT